MRRYIDSEGNVYSFQCVRFNNTKRTAPFCIIRTRPNGRWEEYSGLLPWGWGYALAHLRHLAFLKGWRRFRGER